MSKTVTVVDRIAAGDYSVRAYNGDRTYIFCIVKEGNSWILRNKNGVPLTWYSRRDEVVAEIESFTSADIEVADHVEYARG